MKDNKLDKFYYHEALDRSAIVADIIDRTLVNHPVFEQKENIHLKNMVVKAQQLILEVYQEIGNINY